MGQEPTPSAFRRDFIILHEGNKANLFPSKISEPTGIWEDIWIDVPSSIES